MKTSRLTRVVALMLCCTIGFSSCIGSFKLSHKLLAWNQTVGSKFANEVVFFCFSVIPVYGVSLMADALVLNSIEFWSGRSVVKNEIKSVKGENGDQYLVKRTKNGYNIKNKTQNVAVNLTFDEQTQTWSAQSKDKKSRFMTFIDNNKVMIYLPEGKTMEVELNQQGVLALQQTLEQNFTSFAGL